MTCTHATTTALPSTAPSVPVATAPAVVVPPASAMKTALTFVTGGMAACVAESITVPLDTAKVKMQLRGSGGSVLGVPATGGLTAVIRATFQSEGVRGVFAGLGPGLQRQLVFATLRLGAYEPIKKLVSGGKDDVGIGTKLVSGVLSAGLSITVANPTDVVKVAMQSSPGRFASSAAVYAHVFRTSGLTGFYKGYVPNLARNSSVAGVEIATYDSVKPVLMHRFGLADATPCHLLSAAACGAVATLVASPLDVIKTRMQASGSGALYTGLADCAVKTLRAEGALAFYKGVLPMFFRLVGWNGVMFVTYEQLKTLAHAYSDSLADD